MKPGGYVYCTTSFRGFHRWPNAPSEVIHLRDRHRHTFYVKVVVKVTHANRDVEFQVLQKNVDQVIASEKFGNMERITDSRSCEQFAYILQQKLKASGYTVAQVEVNEDNENGAILVCQ